MLPTPYGSKPGRGKHERESGKTDIERRRARAGPRARRCQEGPPVPGSPCRSTTQPIRVMRLSCGISAPVTPIAPDARSPAPAFVANAGRGSPQTPRIGRLTPGRRVQIRRRMSGTGGRCWVWLFSLFSAANYQRPTPRPAQKSAVWGMQVSAIPSLLFAVLLAVIRIFSLKGSALPELLDINPITPLN
jgi:hypothetical protein